MEEYPYTPRTYTVFKTVKGRKYIYSIENASMYTVTEHKIFL